MQKSFESALTIVNTQAGRDKVYWLSVSQHTDLQSYPVRVDVGNADTQERRRVIRGADWKLGQASRKHGCDPQSSKVRNALASIEISSKPVLWRRQGTMPLLEDSIWSVPPHLLPSWSSPLLEEDWSPYIESKSYWVTRMAKECTSTRKYSHWNLSRYCWVASYSKTDQGIGKISSITKY